MIETKTQKKWPKIFPPLPPEQQQINDDFVKIWHEVLPKKFGVVERFNHNFPVKHSLPGFKTTLEIGAGLGEHLEYERLTPEQQENYYSNEFRENMAREIRRRFPSVKTIVADCQKRMSVPDGFFDRAIAVHVLEHLPDLPSCVKEIYRSLDKTRGQFLIVIPTEGSPAYSLARKISAERVYKKRYGETINGFIRGSTSICPPKYSRNSTPYFTI